MHQEMGWLLKSVYEVGDRLVCLANGNPLQPTTGWILQQTESFPNPF